MLWSHFIKYSKILLISSTVLIVIPASQALAAASDELSKFIAAYQPQDQQAISNLLNEYTKSELIDSKVSVSRQTFGSENAPLSLVEWIDIQCPHCKNLNTALNELQQMTPAESWRIESRHYPLDSECNPQIPKSRNPGVSCLAAKALICLSDNPKLHDIRLELFNQQRFLSKDIIWATIAESDKERSALETCVNSAETAAVLKADIELAEKHKITGTPLVVINGRKSPAIPPIIYALILAEGDLSAEPFKALPPPKAIEKPAHNANDGHDHSH